MPYFTGNELGQAIELFVIARTDRSQYWTSADDAITVDGVVYNPATIRRSRVATAFSAERVECSLESDIDTVFAFLLEDSPGMDIRLTVSKYIVASAVSITIFSGYMESFQLSGRKASVEFRSDGFKLDTLVPRTLIQAACNNLLYDTHCGVDRGMYRITCKVSAYSAASRTLTLQDKAPDSFGRYLSDLAADYPAFGTLYYNHHYRLVTASAASGDNRNVKIIDAFPENTIRVGSIVYLDPGCDRYPNTCRDRFDNLSRFLGFPYAPLTGEASSDLRIVL